MKTELIQNLTNIFEANAQQTEGGVEYWLARDLQHLLGYSKWDNFLKVVSKAKTACEVSNHSVVDHFADVGKMVEHPIIDHFVDVNKTIQCPSLDISGEFYTVSISTPAKPLPSMLNFGGFFFWGRVAA